MPSGAAEGRRLFSILDNAPNAFVAADREWRFLYVNAAAAALMGRPADALVGRTMWDVFPEGVGTRFWDAYNRAMQSQAAVEVEDYFAPLDKWFEVRAYPIEPGIAVHFSDISPRKRLEIALREREERFRQLAENIDDVFWLLDRVDQRIVYVSPAYQAIWGRSGEELYADPSAWMNAIHPEDRERVHAALPAQDSGGWDVTYRILRPDGSLRWIRDRAYPVRDATGAIRRMAGVARDITEQRRLEEQFRQAQKMDAVGRLAGGVAHDFNNLLSVILGYTELTLGRLASEDPSRAHLQEVSRAADRAATLTRQLLAFSRQQVLQPKVVDLGEVVLGMAKMVGPLLGADVELALGGCRPTSKVYADPPQVEQIVMNLAVNARDAMPGGGRLSIETADVEVEPRDPRFDPAIPPGSYVRLSVSDTGVGMDAATRERIFEPFFTTKETGKGTGLGLSTVLGIVEQSSGYLTVKSEPGRGSTFEIYLPRTDRRTDSSSAAIRAAVEAAPGDETILLVEDDDQVRAMLRALLRRQGYDVLDARNGGEALLTSEAFAARIHLLITDVVMPHMSGRELGARLSRARPDLRVLYMSGYAEDAIVRHGILEGGIAFLQKPVTPDAFLLKVRGVLEGTIRARAAAP